VTLHFKLLKSISDISASSWDELAGHNPFSRHAFLKALEDSKIVSPSTGWQSKHQTGYDDKGNLVCLIPLYEKSHSYGEYIFDWSWASAYQRYNLSYYPKLLNAIPYSPITCNKIILSKKDKPVLADVLGHIRQITSDYSSWHSLYTSEEESAALLKGGFIQRQTPHFRWYNNQYESFDTFLQSFRSRKRKQILKERARIQSAGITYAHLEGQDIKLSELEKFFTYYQLTYLNKSGHGGYLSLEFFLLLLETMPENILLINALHQDQTIASAFFIKDDTTLYGRYWGCERDIDFLHFETCYYQGIEYAIKNRLQVFDPGTQGEHKIARGFTPSLVYSNHIISDEQFENAIEQFAEEEKRHSLLYLEEARKKLPFKND